ncbi:MAG: hypothetical protein RJA39_1196, partial [Pseudomonadota bacterium]
MIQDQIQWRGQELDVDQSALVFAHDHPLECAMFENREHFDRQFLVAAQRKGRGVHDAQVFRDGLIKRDLAVTRGVGVL